MAATVGVVALGVFDPSHQGQVAGGAGGAIRALP
jgi:hypothetical protein